ncbi:tetratricopeptide repeat protein [Marinoscillum sp.]|uniref:tetratricopeptide repeat protein n=1 Tax=Marinoscillum sp. TaxID=2024838 RepID=UPI003BA9C879
MIKIRNLKENTLAFQFLLLIAVTCIYAQTITFDYNLDDEIVVSQVGEFSLSGLYESISSPYYALDQRISYGYRPLTSLTFYLESTILGNNPAVSHSINLVLYLLIIGLIFQLGLYLFKKPQYAFILALLFAVHPIHTEVVASIKNRDELLALLFGLLGFLSLRLRGIWSISTTIVCIICSLLAKKTGLGIYLLAPILLYSFHSRSRAFFWILVATMSVALFTMAPSANFSEAIFHVIVYLTGMAVFFYWGHNAYKLDQNIIRGTVAALGVLFISYGVFEKFDPFVVALQTNLLAIYFFFRPGQLIKWVLILNLMAISVLTSAWFFAPLCYILIFDHHQAKNKWLWISGIVVLFVLSVFLMATSSKPFALLFALVYITPFIFEDLKKKWILLTLLGSTLLAIIINSFSGTSLTYIALLICFSIIFLLLLYKKWENHYLGILTCFLALVFYFDSSVSFQSEWLQETHNLGGTSLPTTTTYSGRSLDFIENPLINHPQLSDRLMAMVSTYGHYISQMVYPHNLRFYYGYDSINLFNIPMVLLWLAVITGIIILSMIRGQKYIYLYFILFLIALLPFSNLVVPVAGIVGDRLVFLPSLFFLLFITGLLKKLKSKYTLGIVIVVFCGLLGYLSIERVGVWKNKETLYLHDARQNQQSIKVNQLAGDLLYRQGVNASGQKQERLLKSALAFYRKGASIYEPYYLNWYMMGQIQLILADYKPALESFKHAENSPYVDQNIHLQMAICASFLNDLEMAETYYFRAINHPESKLKAYLNLVFIYLHTDELSQALTTNQKALIDYPENPSLNENHARIYFNMGDTLNTIKYLEHAISYGNDNERNLEFLRTLQR